jgi:6-phosphogluconate dehydrogenase
MSTDIGIMGMGVMGANLARNFARHGYSVSVFDRSQAQVDAFVEKYALEGEFAATLYLQDFVDSLVQPRRILMMVPAGAPTDAAIDEILPLLSPGDVLLDGGNSYFGDTRRREDAIRPSGVRFFGVGVSGGEEGALNGPSIMPGGDPEGYAIIGPLLESIAARVDDDPCCAWLGPDGAGHFVKMVHNGIEYADMQFIAETYDILRHIGGLNPKEIADVFRDWNQGRLGSYLTEIAVEVLAHTDAKTGKAFIDVVQDAAGSKGTGRWTVETGLELSSPVPAIASAVDARSLSGQSAIRVAAQAALRGPEIPAVDRERLIADLEASLWASKVVSYAQGMTLIARASEQYEWQIDPSAAVGLWRGGCIIRAKLLGQIHAAFESDPNLASLLVSPVIAPELNLAQPAWRRLVALSVTAGVPAPGITSALQYVDVMRQPIGSTNMIQGLRDFFGAHTYQRNDTAGVFHTNWSEDRSETRKS